MKKNAKLFEMRNKLCHVIIRLREDGDFSRFLTLAPYIVEVHDFNHRTIKGLGFPSVDEAQAFIFENYSWMFIPSNLVLHEGTRLFVY